MKTYIFDDTNIRFFTYAFEWVNEFYDVPKGAILDETQLPASAHFACVPENEIAIYVREDCSFTELLSTVAHELGHLIEGGFKKNPPEKDRYLKKHEEKAEHYEAFVLKAYKIALFLFDQK